MQGFYGGNKVGEYTTQFANSQSSTTGVSPILRVPRLVKGDRHGSFKESRRCIVTVVQIIIKNVGNGPSFNNANVMAIIKCTCPCRTHQMLV